MYNKIYVTVIKLIIYRYFKKGLTLWLDHLNGYRLAAEMRY